MNKKATLVFSIFSLILLASNVHAFCIDRTAPSAPANLVIHDSPYDADGNMTLTWTAATDGPCASSGVEHYNIYRSSNGVNFTFLGESRTLDFNDFSSLSEGKYYYHVTAVDNVIDNPHEGPAASGSTTVGIAPSAPSSGGTTGGGSFSGSGGGSVTTCKENWSCTDWSDCISGTQTRKCTDLNNCGTTKNKLPESRSCESTPTGTSTENTSTQVPEEAGGIIPSVPTGFFLGLAATDWTIAIIVGIVAAAIIIFMLSRKRKK